MATATEVQADPANGRQARGPRTAEGKARARLDALKNGPRAEAVGAVVAPHEDPAELEARIQAWIDDYRPVGVVERELVERAAKLSWSLDQAERCEAALMARRVRKAMVDHRADRVAEVRGLARKLFYMCGKRAVAGAGPEWDDDPAAFVAALEETAEGTRWLIDRWREIHVLIESGAAWSPHDQFKFIRLLGKHPIDATDDPQLNAIVLAWEAVAPELGVGFWRRIKDLTPLDDPAFSAWRQWRALADAPPDAAAGWASLRSVVTRELTRLSRRLAIVEDAEGTDAQERADRALFSSGDGAERLRRHQVARSRELLRTLDALAKLQKARAAEAPKKAAGEAREAPSSPSIAFPPGEGESKGRRRVEALPEWGRESEAPPPEPRARRRRMLIGTPCT